MTRRTEVNQHRAAVLTQINILRLDVEMQHLGLVHRVQAIQDRDENTKQRLLIQARTVAPEVIRQALPCLVLHDHVGRAIGLEVTQYADNIWVLEPRQRPRFLYEILESGLVITYGIALRIW